LHCGLCRLGLDLGELLLRGAFHGGTFIAQSREQGIGNRR